MITQPILTQCVRHHGNLSESTIGVKSGVEPDDQDIDRDEVMKAPPTIHRAHDDGSIFIHDADLLSVGVPAHASHHRLVAVVDHLLVPGAFTQATDRGRSRQSILFKGIMHIFAILFSVSSRHLCTASTQ